MDKRRCNKLGSVMWIVITLSLILMPVSSGIAVYEANPFDVVVQQTAIQTNNSESTLLSDNALSSISKVNPNVQAAITSQSINDESVNYVYLPLIKNEYEWKRLEKWTPWAFAGEIITNFQSGPVYGQMWAITRDDDWVHKLYRSNNFGENWVRADTGLPYPPSTLAITSGSSPDATIYVGLWYTDMVYSSRDSGSTWDLDGKFEGEIVNYVDFVGDTVYAQTMDPCQIWQRKKTGEWQPIGDNLVNCANDLEVFQSKLYAATNEGLYRLTDSLWEYVVVNSYTAVSSIQSGSYLPMVSQYLNFPKIEIDVHKRVQSLNVHDDVMFVGAEPRGLYKSSDGSNWSACDVGLTIPYWGAIRKLIGSANGRLFAASDEDGVFMSDDGGETWQILDLGLPLSTTAYGHILDGVATETLSLIRDEGDEQTLGAVFYGKGLWLKTVTSETLLGDLEPESPPKAVLIVGPVDPPEHKGTMDLIEWADRLAAIMTAKGINVVKVYWPHSTWENVRSALGGASIVVYKGHGFGVGDISADPTEMHGGCNGFCLVNPEEPDGARLGTQDMLVTTTKLADNAVGFFFCCSCAGSSAADPTPVSIELAKRRIESYASTVMFMGGRAYFSGINEEKLLEDFLNHPTQTLGELFTNIEGQPDHKFTHVLWPDLSVWFDGNTEVGWGGAFVGDPNLTPNDILTP